MKYFLEIIDKESINGLSLLFVVDEKGNKIPRQTNIQIEQGIDSEIKLVLTALTDPPKLRKDGKFTAKITMYFKGRITFQDKLEHIPFTLEEVIEEKTIDDK